MIDWQHDLGGTLFGKSTVYKVLVWDPGVPEWRNQDAPAPGGDGRVFGRDELDGPLWAFELSMSAPSRDHGDALALLAPLKAAWANSDRSTPGAVVPMRYALGGRTRRVYGRPRRFSPLLDTLVFGRVHVVADFQCRDHLHYDDAEQVLVLTQVPTSSTGLTFPLVLPFSMQPFGSRQGAVTNTGDAASPLLVEFTGPSVDPSLTLTGGDEIGLRMTLSSFDRVVVDTAARTVLLNGANVSGRLTRGSRFFALPPGAQELRYTALDPTASSKVTVRWRDAHTSL